MYTKVYQFQHGLLSGLGGGLLGVELRPVDLGWEVDRPTGQRTSTGRRTKSNSPSFPYFSSSHLLAERK